MNEIPRRCRKDVRELLKQAIESERAKAEGLVEALDNIADCDCEIDILEEHICGSDQEIARLALAHYRKEKKG